MSGPAFKSYSIRLAAVLLLALASGLVYGQSPAPALNTNANPNAVAEDPTQLARLMLADAEQWAQRGWKDAAIKLARRAAAIETEWAPGELTPQLFLEQIESGGIASSSFAPRRQTTAPSTTPRIAPNSPDDNDVQAASFTTTPLNVDTVERPLPSIPVTLPSAATNTVAPASEIRLVLENGMRSPSPHLAAAAPAAPQPAVPDSSESHGSDWFGDSGAPSWRTLALMLFVALALMLLRDVRLPGQLQIQLTKPQATRPGQRETAAAQHQPLPASTEDDETTRPPKQEVSRGADPKGASDSPAKSPAPTVSEQVERAAVESAPVASVSIALEPASEPVDVKSTPVASQPPVVDLDVNEPAETKAVANFLIGKPKSNAKSFEAALQFKSRERKLNNAPRLLNRL